MAVVATREVTKIYRLGQQEVHALSGVTLTVEAAEFVAVMGRSGSGKSTLLNLIGCLDRPTSGTVSLAGVEVSHLPENRLPSIRRGKVGFVFQNFSLIPSLTALENVLLPLKYARLPARKARRRAMEILEAVEMGHRLAHRPIDLSGGEQQRVAIARALVNNPAVVLADEPTGELDTQTARTVIQLMQRLNGELGQTFLIVTHDPMVTEQASRVIRLEDGRVESDTRLGPGQAQYRSNPGL